MLVKSTPEEESKEKKQRQDALEDYFDSLPHQTYD